MSNQWPAQAARPRVLIVEDQKDSNFSFARMLQHLECDFDICQSGEKAIARAIDFQPHLVLLDMELLTNDGYAVAVALRHQVGAQAMIVAVTSEGAQRRTLCEASGVDMHVFKPVEMETLRMLLDEAGLKMPAT
jgi:CheY-like chemotaxis protein